MTAGISPKKFAWFVIKNYVMQYIFLNDKIDFLIFKPLLVNSLRDLQTGFIGEIGQGLSVFHFSEKFFGKHAQVEHFDSYIKKHGIAIEDKHSSPDYIVKTSDETYFLESKASVNGSKLNRNRKLKK